MTGRWERVHSKVWLLALLAACKPSEGIELTRGASASATIGPEGGSVTLGETGLTLAIPAGALATTEEITVTALDGADGAWIFEPSGLEFAIPAVATFPYTPVIEESSVPVYAIVSDDGSAELRGATVLDGTATLAVDHFSLWFRWFEVAPENARVFAYMPGFQGADVLHNDYAPDDLNVDLFGVGSHRIGDPILLSLTLAQYGPLAGRAQLLMYDADTPRSMTDTVVDFTAAGMSLGHFGRVVSSEGYVSLIDTENPPDGSVVPPSANPNDPIALVRPGTLSATAVYRCEAYGDGTALAWADTWFTGVRIGFGGAWLDGITLSVDGASVPVTFGDGFAVQRAIRYGIGCQGVWTPLVETFGPAVEPVNAILSGETEGLQPALAHVDCTWLSTEEECATAEPTETIETVVRTTVDVDSTTRGAASARLFDAEFPCDATGDRTVICASGATSDPGVYVVLDNVMGAPLNTEDTTGSYQYGFVFDADGDATNNYAADTQYPGDFWQGTDKWYELTYAPATGYRARVRDVRQNFADVPSGARFVIEGRDLLLFVPRSELGANPSYRATAFRHEGDWGLDGGPWSADYFPDLDEPLLPVDLGEPIVLTQ